MNILFIGAVTFSARALETVIALGGHVVGVCTLKNSSFHADFCDLGAIAGAHDIPLHYAEDINGPESVAWIARCKPDVIFCFGWSRLLKAPILDLAPLGVVGFHPAALPANRGRHPLVWALVLGLKETASTFFFMDGGADSGDILSQQAIPIDDADDAGSLYAKVMAVAAGQIADFLPKLAAGDYPRLKQDDGLANLWRKRGKADGLIDWRMSAQGIHNLVRGLARPYVGAHFEHNQAEYKVWKSQIVEDAPANIEPGKVLAVTARSHPIVKCGDKAIKLLEIVPDLKIAAGTYL